MKLKSEDVDYRIGMWDIFGEDLSEAKNILDNLGLVCEEEPDWNYWNYEVWVVLYSMRYEIIYGRHDT